MAVGVSKCKITEYSLSKLGELYYGVLCSNTVNSNIFINYIEHLNCKDVFVTVCDPLDCPEPYTSFTCTLKVIALLYSQDEENNRLFKFTIPSNSIAGGKEPYTYNWIYEEDDFEVTEEGINSSELKLILKPGKVLSNLVTSIRVDVVDANGCSATRNCYLAYGSMQCGVNYVSCSNPNSLVVSNILTTCAKPSSLILSKI